MPLMHDGMTTSAQKLTETVADSNILLVDDEPGILSALRRLLRRAGYNTHLAHNGQEGLSILRSHKVDLVISDMSMPEMDGARFLEQVAHHYPDCVRLLLTGHSDLEATIDAINNGMIYRYISKPWNDEELLLTVRQGIENQRLTLESRRLHELTNRQNSELQRLNQHLEEEVARKTVKIRHAAQQLEVSNHKLNRAYENTIRVFSSLIDMKASLVEGHARRVAELSRDIALEMGLTGEDVEDIYFAGLLHEIGKLPLPDSLLETPINKMSPSDRKKYRRHPLLGQEALTAVETLQGAGLLIRNHEELWDGGGFPDGLSGEEIPLGARILSIAKDFSYLRSKRQTGSVEEDQYLVKRISRFSGSRYDPELIEVLNQLLLNQKIKFEDASEVRLTTMQLAEGMRLSRDLYNSNELLLLTKDRCLTASLISRLVHIEKVENSRLLVYIHAEQLSC